MNHNFSRGLAIINVLVGLYFGFLFYIGPLWGVDDDADLSRIAWGHLAVRHFIESLRYAVAIAFICLIVNWLASYFAARDSVQSTKCALSFAALTLLITVVASAIGCVQFYITHPVGI